jgi:hypothetical protein
MVALLATIGDQGCERGSDVSQIQPSGSKATRAPAFTFVFTFTGSISFLSSNARQRLAIGIHFIAETSSYLRFDLHHHQLLQLTLN